MDSHILLNPPYKSSSFRFLSSCSTSLSQNSYSLFSHFSVSIFLVEFMFGSSSSGPSQWRFIFHCPWMRHWSSTLLNVLNKYSPTVTVPTPIINDNQVENFKASYLFGKVLVNPSLPLLLSTGYVGIGSLSTRSVY